MASPDCDFLDCPTLHSLETSISITMRNVLLLALAAASSASTAEPSYERARDLLLKWEKSHTKGTITYIAGGAGNTSEANRNNPDRDPHWHRYEFDGRKERLVSRPWKEGEDASKLYSQYQISVTDGRKHFDGETIDHVNRVDSKALLNLYERKDHSGSIGPQNLLIRRDDLRRHSEWLAEASKIKGFAVSEEAGRISIQGPGPGGREVLEIDAGTGKPLRSLFVGSDPDSITVEHRLVDQKDGTQAVEFSAHKAPDSNAVINRVRMTIIGEEYGKVDQTAFDFEKAPPGSTFWDVDGRNRYIVLPNGRRDLVNPSGGPSQRPPQNALPSLGIVLGAVGVLLASGAATLLMLRSQKKLRS